MSLDSCLRSCRRLAKGLALSIVLAAMERHGHAQQQGQATNQAILERLDKLETQNRELLEEIKALRQMLAPKAAAANDEAPLAERQEVSEHRIDELAQTKVEASQRFPLQLTGTLLMNAFLNGAHGGAAQNPTAAALTAAPGAMGASFRQTVLGLKFHGPETVWGGTLAGSVYMDFFGGSDQSLNHLLRLRLATIEVDWPNTTFAVGQDKPLVSRREPNSLAQVGVSPLTNAGNPWLWEPQARIEQKISLGDKTLLKAEAGVFETAETANQPSNIAGRITAQRPSFETRIAIRHTIDDKRMVEIAPVLHFSTSHVGGASVASRLYGVDWLIKPAGWLEISGLAFHGQNFANLGALGGISVDAANRFIPVHGSGGWLQFHYQATRKLSFNTYGGLQDDRNRDLSTGQIGRNQYLAANMMYLLAPNVIGAFEAGQNRTTYAGIGNRINNHYDLALGYLF